MDDTLYKIAIAGLLHDIGKFMQRAELEKDYPEIKENYDQFCPLSETGAFTHLHAAYSAFFIEHFIPEGLFDKTALYDSARHHKNPADDIYRKADIISATMDRYDDESEAENYKTIRLYSVFDLIELQYSITDERENINPRWLYALQPLSENNVNNLFPKFHKNSGSIGGALQESVNEYRYLWDKFRDEVESIQHYNDHALFFNELYWLLEKYTWCIPSATNVFPDVSLFDHSKTTAAISTVLYHINESSETSDRQFLIYAGDISGIQNYIFKISQAQSVGGIAKRLRGRSFFINMLSEVLAGYIIGGLGYSKANVNFCGGGNFELLLANTSSTKKFLENFENELNMWLVQNYQGELAFVGALLAVTSDQLKAHYNRCKESIDEKIAIAKLRKYKNIVENHDTWIEQTAINGPITICPSCNLKVISHDDEICEACKLDKKVGSALPLSAYIRFRNRNQLETDGNVLVSLDYGKFGSVDLIGKSEKDTSLTNLINNSSAVYSISSENNYVKAEYPIAKTLPYATETIEGLVSEKDEEGDSILYPNQSLSFTTLADIAEGDKRIGILKMDVDNLGLIFTNGFPSALSKDLISISRIAALSRSLSTFFSYVIDQTCQKIFYRWQNETSWTHRGSISNIFYLTFSGGDDLLVIGPWDQIIVLAGEIRKQFKKYTCENPNLSISAGIYICKPKYPISMAIQKASEALHRSKTEGKNRITIMGETLVWDEEDEASRVFQEELKSRYISFRKVEIREKKIFLRDNRAHEKIQETLTFEELMQFAQKMLTAYKEKKISRKFIHRLLEAKELFFQTEYNDLKQREEEIHNYMFIPYLFYNIERNVKSDEKAAIKKILITEGNAEMYVRQAKLPCKYVLMKTRN